MGAGPPSGDQGRNLIPNVAEVAPQDRNINHKQNHMKHHETPCTLAQGRNRSNLDPSFDLTKKTQNEHVFRHECKKKNHVFNLPHDASCVFVCVCVCVVLSEKHVHGNIAIRALLQNLI